MDELEAILKKVSPAMAKRKADMVATFAAMDEDGDGALAAAWLVSSPSREVSPPSRGVVAVARWRRAVVPAYSVVAVARCRVVVPA